MELSGELSILYYPEEDKKIVNRAEDQIPIHVQQVLWLTSNAEVVGYERRGDSWILNE